MKRKQKMYQKDGVTYITLVALAEMMNCKQRKLWDYRAKGALVRVKTDKGVYFTLGKGWKMEQVMRLVREETEQERKYSPLRPEEYLWMYPEEEFMQKEGINYAELYVRFKKGVYRRDRKKRYRYLMDEEWEKLSKAKKEEYAHVPHGDAVVERKDENGRWLYEKERGFEEKDGIIL